MSIIIDFESDDCISEIQKLGRLENSITDITVYLPLGSFGRSNSRIDLCDDLIEAAYCAEQLAAKSEDARATFDYDPDRYRTRIKIQSKSLPRKVLGVINDAAILYHSFLDENLSKEQEDRYSQIRGDIGDFEDGVATLKAHFPEIIDHYLVNLVNGVYCEGENPDWVRAELATHRERLFSFHKSAYSATLGANVFASMYNWIVPSSIPLQTFFSACGYRISSDDFNEAELLNIGGVNVIIAGAQITQFPMEQLYASRFCIEAVEEMDTPIGAPRLSAPSKCALYKNGEIAYVNEGSFVHLFFDLKPLNEGQVLSIYNYSSTLLKKVAEVISVSQKIKLDWPSLSDEQFEELCYDIIYQNPKFDISTIKKMGKSRARDGGRDIVVHTNPNSAGKRKKWIFQCKLVTSGASLSASKVQDVGDILDQYGAEGYGVMTSTVIDSTLYDKLEKVCSKRRVEERHYSVYELERFLLEEDDIRRRYFLK